MAASTDPKDLEPFTRNHILLHKPNLNTAFDAIDDQEINSRKRYPLYKIALVNKFWNYSMPNTKKQVDQGNKKHTYIHT